MVTLDVEAKQQITKSVVLLDDDFVIRQVIKIVMADVRRMLDIGIKVYTSGNGVEGLGYIALSKPNILIVDATLPKYSGRELIEFIASNPKYQTPDIRVIVLSDRKLPMKLPANHVVINKEDMDFIHQLTKACIDGFVSTNDVAVNAANGETGVMPDVQDVHIGLWTRIKLGVSGMTIRIANRADLRMAAISSTSNVFVRIPGYLIWFLQQVYISFLMGMGNFFNDKIQDENISQSRADLARFRVREYPTLATVFLTLFFIFFQTGLLVVGGIVVFSVRIESVFADYNPEFNLDLSKATFDSSKVEFKNNKIALKEIASIPTSSGSVDSSTAAVPNTTVNAPSVSAGQGTLLEDGGLSTKANIKADVYPFDNPQVLISAEGLEYSKLISILEISNMNTAETSTAAITSVGFSIPSVAITYQLSPDGQTWYYYNLKEGAWKSTTLGLGQSNVIQQVNHYLGDFDEQVAKNKKIYLKIFLHSDGSTPVTLSGIKINRVLNVVTPVETAPTTSSDQPTPTEPN